ncbi:unnamed protein product [Thelazia callipaeda]|uniref:UPF0183 protein n=1 Tax=Thelazia callipaeda TaxID=103827 RepID=A0A0N5D6D2_THECL|nr:unnamed protein product [Thelazia callipaeda]
MLKVEVIPGRGIRNHFIEILLGMPINQAIIALHNASKHIQNVELTYSSQEPLTRDIIIRLVKDGIRFYFEPNSQLLRLIEIYDFSHIFLQYGGVVFSGPDDEADVNKVEKCFGATHPGVYVAEQNLYELSWKGLSFTFPTVSETSKFQASPVGSSGLGSLHYKRNSPPVLSKMTIYRGSHTLVRNPQISGTSLCGTVASVEVKAITDKKRIVGLFFTFVAEVPVVDESSPKQSFGPKKIERSIHFGDTTESVLSALGTPSKIFYTKADRMLIHRGEDSKKLRGPRPNYFFNYLSLGVDLLFDCITNRVQKFILHTNFPGHFDFGMCRESFLAAFCGDTSVQPVVLTRSGTDNPFGSTFCYGTDQVIVEVMDNGFIASVIIF